MIIFFILRSILTGMRTRTGQLYNQGYVKMKNILEI